MSKCRKVESWVCFGKGQWVSAERKHLDQCGQIVQKSGKRLRNC